MNIKDLNIGDFVYVTCGKIYMLKRQVVRLFPEANYAVLECAQCPAHSTQDKIIRKAKKEEPMWKKYE